MSDAITYHILTADNADLLIGSDVFDRPVDQTNLAAFVADPRHHLIFAMAGETVVGFASGTVLLHPDQEPLLFINEVGVEQPWQPQGIATALSERLLALGRDAGCKGVWLATETDNIPARALYQGLNARETEGIVVYDWDGAMDPA